MRISRTAASSGRVQGILWKPEAPGPHPALVVLGGSEGGAPEAAAKVLAGLGFAALALAYFGVAPLPAELEEVPLELFTDACRWLDERSDVDTRALTLVGRSRGGELALLLGSRHPDIVQAVVAYVPSSVVWQSASSSLPGSSRACSSWSVAGAAVPFVPALRDPTPRVGAAAAPPRSMALRPFFERAMQQHDAVAAAAIAVEKIAGPVLLVSGGCDRLWPSSDFCEQVLQRRRAHAHPRATRHLSYPDAGHRIGIPGTTYADQAAQPWLDMGGCREADDHASRECWPAVVEFLREASRPAPEADAKGRGGARQAQSVS
jgi:dienelactone hydrolase